MKNTLLQKQHRCFSFFMLFGLSFTCFFIPTHLKAQKYFTAEKSFAVKLGRTKPIYESVSAPATDPDKLKENKANKPEIIPNFGGRRPLKSHNPNALPLGMDPVFDSATKRLTEVEILPLVNIEGIPEGSSGSTPPDVNGDVGKDYYVEIVNATFFKVFDKAGVAVSGLISANTIWSQVQQSSSGDPILLYDQQADRWLLTEFPSNNRVLVAISLTSDPRGSWDAYSFQTPRFPDFPKYGIWNNAYYLTDNESGNNAPIYAINRDDILAGEPTARIQRLTVPKIGGVSFEVGQPVDWDGQEAPPDGSPALVVKLNDDDWGFAANDEIRLHKITINWSNSDSSNIEVVAIPTAPFDTDGCQLESTGGFSCIPQPNGQGIDGAEWIICNKAQYRNFGTYEAFVMCFMVDVTGGDVAGIRWIEFRKTSTEDWHIYQEGTVGSTDGIHRFMPSISIDGRGNIGLGYSVSGNNKFPSLRYTGRYVTDPLGTMSIKEYEFATGHGSQGQDRFGDYAAMAVDPADDATFWFSGEYLPTNDTWGTRIVAFRASRDTFDIFPVTLNEPVNDAILGEQNVSFHLLNRGLNTVFSFPVGYQFNNGSWVTETPVLDSLPIDQEFAYTFATPVNITAPGNYPIRIATFLDIDNNKKNDTLSFMITKYAFRDLALEYVVPTGDPVVCAGHATNTVRVQNNGLDLITSFSLEVSVNGTPVDTFNWTGELNFQEETLYNFEIQNLLPGDNEISVTILYLNETPDEIPSNNELTWSLTAVPDGQEITLHFTTDNFPQESTWKLFDDTNQVIASGGPYTGTHTLYDAGFCLNPEACYHFTVYDSFGDGMSAQGVQGDFEIVNESGHVLADLIKPNFGSQSTSQFCLTAMCLFTAQVGVEQESAPGAGDAIALVDVANGLGNIQYSINGGVTFQTSNSFVNLIPGTYSIIAKDGAGCADTVNFEVVTCNLQALITTTPAIGGDVGQIHIDVAGNNGPLFYSLQGGAFVSDSFFLMLEPGDYVVTVKDSSGCEITDTVTVSTNVGTTSFADDAYISIYPNPGKGVYQVEASFASKNVFMNYYLCSSLGKILYHGSLVRYDDTYKGEISLTAYPAGVYYMAFPLGQKMIVRRIIKLNE